MNKINGLKGEPNSTRLILYRNHYNENGELMWIEALEEKKKGKWKETDDGWDGTYYVCSECGCPWTLIDGTPEDNGMNFCPNCGARME